MSERLQGYLARNQLRAEQARAGAQWRGDWLACGQGLRHRSMLRACSSAMGARQDVMHEVARERLHQVEAALGGRANPTFRVAYGIVLQDRDACAVAEQLGIRSTSAMDLLRLALTAVAGVYLVRELG